MLRRVLQSCLIAAVAVPAHAQAAQAVEARAKTKWTVDFAEDRCVASRAYQVGDQEWIIGIEPNPTTNETMIFAVVPSTAGAFDDARFFAADAPIATNGLAPRRTDTDGRRHYAAGLEASEYARLQAAETLRVESRGRSVALDLKGLPLVQRQLKACTADLLETWGLTAEQQARLATFPAAERDPASYLRKKDFPSDARDDATVLVQVNSDGRAEECAVIQSTGNADLDARTCTAFIDRARFRPARDKSGKAVAAPYVASFRVAG